MTTNIYALTDAEHATVLAALRHYQRDMPTLRTSGVYDIASSMGTLEPLGVEMVDDLVGALSHSLAFGEIMELLGTSDDPYALAGRDMSAEGSQVDLPTIVSHGEDGAYVMGWLWVPNSALAEEDNT